jgi:hypothetical protein
MRPTSTATCGCGTLLATWDPGVHAWIPPLGEAARIHDRTCPLTTNTRQRRTA